MVVKEMQWRCIALKALPRRRLVVVTWRSERGVGSDGAGRFGAPPTTVRGSALPPRAALSALLVHAAHKPHQKALIPTLPTLREFPSPAGAMPRSSQETSRRVTLRWITSGRHTRVVISKVPGTTR